MNLNRLADEKKTESRLPDLIVAGLIPVRSSPLAAKRPDIGSTVTNVNNPMTKVSVAGQPSIQLERLPNGGVSINIRRMPRFPGLVDAHDLEGWLGVGDSIIRYLENMSHGPLTAKDRRRLGYPYGRGLRVEGGRYMLKGKKRGKLGRIGHVKGIRGSVPNMNIINNQTGRFDGAWRREIDLSGPESVLRIICDDPVIAYLAFGTYKMQAHGPFTYAAVKFLPQINSVFQKAVRAAYARKRVEADLLNALGIFD